eukprot:gene10400-biopygen16786
MVYECAPFKMKANRRGWLQCWLQAKSRGSSDLGGELQARFSGGGLQAGGTADTTMQDVAHLQRNAARCCKMLQDAANLRCITGHAYEWHCKFQQVAARCITLAMECSKMQQDAAKCCKMQQNTAAPNSMLCCIRTGTHKYSILQQVAARCCICGFIL